MEGRGHCNGLDPRERTNRFNSKAPGHGTPQAAWPLVFVRVHMHKRQKLPKYLPFQNQHKHKNYSQFIKASSQSTTMFIIISRARRRRNPPHHYSMINPGTIAYMWLVCTLIPLNCTFDSESEKRLGCRFDLDRIPWIMDTRGVYIPPVRTV